ncbi:dTDP-4-dehydrorhamnose reductase [Alishewanella sp. HH-ZS]|uniref:dTDP-4-dehydrorhamnose reductase n=1 Tax=Alishewanella sp. HH-ZS TaxID=1856684 RepID=UPI0008236976|nr:dTDP-4-dehydrorhamnose reductase [Alishewanella sp. HH-ZS]OCW96332.1 dTDP-4-dehydrorhamnose reductase [Alishewanella sp. HH-ZS]
MQLTPQLKVALTGANGQLGYQLAKKLADKVTLLALDRAALDIANNAQVEQTLLAFAPDVIINAAAYTAVDKAEQEPELAKAINATGPQNLAKVAAKLDAVLIHVSTDYVFDGCSDNPYVESDATNPQSMYGLTKLWGEQAIAKYCAKHIILRTSWVFAEHGNNFVKTMLRLAQSRSELGVVADQIGGPTYAGDIAEAIISILAQLNHTGDNRFGLYHYSGAPYVSWHQFACGIFQNAFDQQLIANPPKVNAITTAQYPTPAKRPAFSILNCSKIEQRFSVTPSNWQAALNNLTLYK